MDGGRAIDDLVAPLADGAGVDPRAGGPGSETYFAVKDARADARLRERDAIQSGDPDADPLRAGLKAWQEVAAGATQVLNGSSKDLEVAAWLCEARLRTDGFHGLASGIALLARLIEDWWERGLHPAEDEADEEARIAPLIGLFGRGEPGTLLGPIKLLPLTDHGVTPVALWTIETVRAQSVRHDDEDVRNEMIERRDARLAEIEESIARASPVFTTGAVAAIADALDELDRLMAAIDARTSLGRFGSQVSRPLEDILALLSGGASEAAPDDADPPGAVADGAGEPRSPGPEIARPVAALDRDAALATLMEVAAFFDRNEPQSLIGQSLRDVVRRAHLPVGALLAELLPDAEQRTMFLLRAGIRGSAEDDCSY